MDSEVDDRASLPLQPVYPLGAPGASLDLFAGDLGIAGNPATPGRVWLDTAPRLRVRWAEDEPGGSLELGPTSLRLEVPGLGQLSLGAEIQSAGASRSGTCALRLNDPLVRLAWVTIHWMNLPMILPAQPLRAESGGTRRFWAGRWEGVAEGWRLTLDARPDHSETWEALRSSELCAITHVGRLSREDGATFSTSDAEHVLQGFQVALSFALGRWTAPALPVGFDEHGARVWEQWQPWHCDPVEGHFAWWPATAGEDLEPFLALFMAAWLDTRRHPVVNHLARHAIATNGGNVIEARLMVAHAGLEYLSWVTYVLSGVRSRTAHETSPPEGGSVAEHHLRELLGAAQIPLAIPHYLSKLPALAPQADDGPSALVWLRNRLTHPKDAAEPYRIEGAAADAWLLAGDYLQLLSLHWLGYEGRYGWREPGRWQGDAAPVPWAGGKNYGLKSGSQADP